MASEDPISERNIGSKAAEAQSSPHTAEDGLQRRGEKRKCEQKGKGHFQQGSKRNKRRDLGRQEYFRSNVDKRQRTENHRTTQREHDGGNADAKPFTQEEIENDVRQPKRKVAVMIGYAGSGYKGMQMVSNQKTIEGDLFQAFVKAGAISKANADDPKKSSFVRCARTDKGVHAAGNVVSLKLIIEDPDIVKRINENLPEQIRVWGIERTVASFSCYQACDSRWYEYLIPTHSFLPPHPKSYLGQKLVELADEMGDLEGYNNRQEEVSDFWERTEEEYIKPILDKLDDEIRAQVEQALYQLNDDAKVLEDDEDEVDDLVNDNEDVPIKASADENNDEPQTGSEVSLPDAAPSTNDLLPETSSEQPEELRQAIRALKDAYLLSKRNWRISPARLSRVQEAFGLYKGTHNFHNYTVRKHFKDPSARRHIISFKVNPRPIIIRDTEWLSLKVHGQSFMMHQIRKMVGMASLLVRCGTNIEGIMKDSFQDKLYSIPKVPGLGLLLERPVFENYNSSAAQKYDRAEIGFEKYENEMNDFKMTEIYGRIWDEEEKDNVFHSFYSHVDNYRVPTFLYLSSKGLAASGVERRAVEKKHQLTRKERAQEGKRKRERHDGDGGHGNTYEPKENDPAKPVSPSQGEVESVFQDKKLEGKASEIEGGA